MQRSSELEIQAQDREREVKRIKENYDALERIHANEKARNDDLSKQSK